MSIAINKAPAVAASPGELRAMVQAKDWTRTRIGTRAGWSPTLEMMVEFVLANRFPILLWWGPDYVSIYNDAYRPILGTKHPDALGRPFREVWPEVSHILEPMIDAPFKGGPASFTDDILLEVQRYGFTEETHFTFAYSPVPDTAAPRGIGGVICTVQEITEQVVGERRIAALRDLGVRAGEAKTSEEACIHAGAALALHDKDIPFALFYLLDDAGAKTKIGGRRARLAATAGVPFGNPAAVADVALDAPGHAWRLGDVLAARSAVTIGNLEGVRGAAPPGPWSDPPDTAVVLPLKSGAAVAGFLVAGVSPRLRLDAHYRAFLDLAASQISTGLTAAQAYEEERRRAEALAEIDRAKTTFFSNVSHEFRTPLSLILGPLTDALSADRSMPAEQVELVHRNALRLLKLVNSLLDFSRLEAGRATVHYAATDLAILTTELASNFRSACDGAGLTLTVDCAPLGAPVYVDRDMWEKIVLNLMSNAFKFTFEGGITVKLTEHAFEESGGDEGGGEAVLTVSDTGVGIPRDEMPRIFERFHRIDGQRSRTFEGSGIGLSLVAELTRLMGGVIAVDSVPDKGSVFTVRLPLGVAPQAAEAPATAPPFNRLLSTQVAADAYVQEALRWLPDAPPTNAVPAHVVPVHVIDDATPGDTRGARAGTVVVLADDNADMRAYISRLLHDCCEVRAFADGAGALAEARKNRPDLLLSDMMMPGMDGFELLRAVRADPGLADLPVILLSARAGEDARVEGLKAGANDYITKPFSARELIARVNANLDIDRLRRAATAALRESEQRFRGFVTASADVVYRMSPDWSELRYLDGKDFIADSHVPSRGWMETYVHFEDQPRVKEAIARAVREKCVFAAEHRVRRVNGTLGWAASRAIPMLDAGGAVIEWFGTATDITARRKHEDHQRMLLDELNHRVKNTLTTVQSIVSQTLRSAGYGIEARAVLDARLVALAKAHDVLTREEWLKADIRDVAEAVTAPYSGAERTRIVIDGISMPVRPRAALALSMALHELSTNAVKYGALSNGTGRVTIRWRCHDQGRFDLEWREEGGPPVVPPTTRGFGIRLIERGLAQDLAGEVKLDFAPAGVLCTIKAATQDFTATRSHTKWGAA